MELALPKATLNKSPGYSQKLNTDPLNQLLNNGFKPDTPRPSVIPGSILSTPCVQKYRYQPGKSMEYPGLMVVSFPEIIYSFPRQLSAQSAGAILVR